MSANNNANTAEEKIIRTADEPKVTLMKKFDLSEKQVDAILEMRLRHLAKLEEQKIVAEQKELLAEAKTLKSLLNSEEKLTQFIRDELHELRTKFADERRSRLVVRPQAQVLKQEVLTPVELVTVILSKKGWIRAAKGHEVNGETLSYHAGDCFLAQVRGRSNDFIVFLDSTGKSYSLLANTLPSARGLGEPLTSRLNPPPESTFVALLIDNPEIKYLIASDAGYGFITAFENLFSKNRGGKALLKVPAGSCAMAPIKVLPTDDQLLAVITQQGRLLIFPLSELPELPKGKGNKIIQLPSAQVANREDFCVQLVLLEKSSSLTLLSGKRSLTLKPSDLTYFHGERGRRGQFLPKGFRKFEKVEVTIL